MTDNNGACAFVNRDHAVYTSAEEARNKLIQYLAEKNDTIMELWMEDKVGSLRHVEGKLLMLKCQLQKRGC